MSQSKRILVVVTSHDQIDASHPTGLWFEEFSVPYLAFVGQGLSVTVASPRGGSVPVDPGSEPHTHKDHALSEVRAALQQTRALHEVQVEEFDAIFLPGGHGTMFDLPDNGTLQRLLADFAQAGKVIGAVCHGPAGFVGVRLADGTSLVAGKIITSFTDSEERAVALDMLMPFLLETRLRELGGRFVAEPDWTDHVERDGTLITGQNPQSSGSVARALMDAIFAW